MSSIVTGGTSSDVQRAVIHESDPASEGLVILRGKINFGGETVTVDAPKRSLTIDAHPFDLRVGKHPVIDGGGGLDTASDGTALPRPAFDINAPGQKVTIQNLHFNNTQALAIRVQAVKDLLITLCVINKIKAVDVKQKLPNNSILSFPAAGGIIITENASGDITLQDNVIDVGGTDKDRTFGIQINQKDSTASPATIHITGNTLMNTTAHGVILRDINGTATIEGKNRITTGSIGGQNLILADKFVDGIMCQGSGTYVVRGNLIECGYENAAGIRLQGTSALIPITMAHVIGNEIRMSLLANKVPGSESAGIELRRNCRSNPVANNKISGAALAAISLIAEPSLMPDHNSLFDNVVDNALNSSIADIFVGGGVTNTRISYFFDSTSNAKAVSDVGAVSDVRAVTIIDEGIGTTMLGSFVVLHNEALL
jgi:hypothetical protein